MNWTERPRFWLGIVLLGLVWPAANHAGGSRILFPLAILCTGVTLVGTCKGIEVEGRRLSIGFVIALVIGFGIRAAGSPPGMLWLSLAPVGFMVLPLVRRARENDLIWRLWICGIVIFVGSALMPLQERLALSFHDLAFSKGAEVLPGMVESPLGTPAKFIHFWDGSTLHSVRLTYGVLGIWELLFLIAATGTVALLMPLRQALKSFAVSILILAVCATIRFALITALAIELNSPSTVWNSTGTVLSWVPAGLILGMWQEPRMRIQLRAPRLRVSAGILLLTIAGIVFGFGIGFKDPGNLKGGRVLIDEARANWEWTEEPFDTTSFGVREEYNYFCLRTFLSHFFDVTVASDSLTSQILKDYDVLILKTLTEPYTESQVESIVEFVRSGGGLLLIGDHTNLFGMTTYLNRITRSFGFRFRYDDTFDLQTGGLSAFTRGSLCYHPAVRFVDQFEFLTSCSIEPGWHTEPVMVGRSLGSEDADYGHPNFFGNITFDLCDRFGSFVQAAAARFGEGRVLLFTDSTCFSNFCMFGPGRPELILGFIDFLNRQGKRMAWVRPACWLTGSLCALAGLILNRRGGSGKGAVVLATVAGLMVGPHSVSALNAGLYGPVPAHTELDVVLFDTEKTDASFFDYGFATPARRPDAFGEFYISFLRMGFTPRAGAIGQIDEIQPIGCVIMNPCRSFSQEEVNIIVNYLKQGGRLLVMDGVLNRESTANQLTREFGVRIRLTGRRVDNVTTLPDLSLGSGVMEPMEFLPSLMILGGSPIRTDTRGYPVAVSVDVGKGKAIVMVDSFAYSEVVLQPVMQKRYMYRDCRDSYREIFNLVTHLVR